MGENILKYYKRKGIKPILFLICSLFVLSAGIVQLILSNYTAAVFLILVALILLYDASVYKRPYLGLSDEKLLINNGHEKIEILLTDINSLSEDGNGLIVRFREASTSRKMKARITLSLLKNDDSEQFLNDLKSKLRIILHYAKQSPEELEEKQ